MRQIQLAQRVGHIDDRLFLLFTSGVRHHDGNSQACNGQWSDCAEVFAAGECTPSGAAGSVRGGGREQA